MDLDETLRRLRAADPAADVTGTWDGSFAQERATAGYSEAVAKRRRPTTLIAALAAAAVVAAVAIGVSLFPRPARTIAGDGTAATGSAIPSSSTPPTGSTTPPTGDPHAETDALLAQLLAAVSPPPGASPAQTPPDPAVSDAASGPGSDNALEQAKWWTAPGSVDDVLAFYRAHPPDGLTLSGLSSTGNTRTGSVGPESLIFNSPDTDYAREVQVSISVIAMDSGVAVGAYAQAIWIPVRDPDTVLAGVSSVDVVVTRTKAPGRPGAPTVTRTLTGADAQTLTDAINALPVPTPGVFSCPAMFGGITDDLTFVTAAGTVHAVEDLTGCEGIMMTLPDGTTHGLASGDFNATLMGVLGLPANYGLG